MYASEYIREPDDWQRAKCSFCGAPIRLPALTDRWTHMRRLPLKPQPAHNPRPRFGSVVNVAYGRKP